MCHKTTIYNKKVENTKSFYNYWSYVARPTKKVNLTLVGRRLDLPPFPQGVAAKINKNNNNYWQMAYVYV